MSKIILIVGPTATGKTKLSIYLAKKYNAEIINADSTAIYKEPIISTAKVTNEEMDGIKHHMINLVSLNDDYTIYNYQTDARSILDKLIKENKNVIIVGGSGLYIKALLYDYKLEKEEISTLDLSSYSNEELKKMADMIHENDIHINNRQRLERFIKKYSNKNEINEENTSNNKVYDFISIGLTASRETLYEKINDRVEVMVNNGLIDEAKDLYLKKYKNFNNIIDLKEFSPYFENKISLEEVKEEIKKDTRHYAKRQLTWFNNQMKDIVWFNVDYDNFNNTIKDVQSYLDNKKN